MKKNILFVNTSNAISGAEISLLCLLRVLDNSKFNFFGVVPNTDGNFSEELGVMCPTLKISFPFQDKKIHSFSFIYKQIKNCFTASIQLIQLATRIKADIIYANSTKAAICCLGVVFIKRKKLIWHVRDNIKYQWLAKFIGYFSCKIICISAFIEQQIKGFPTKKIILYNLLQVPPQDTAYIPVSNNIIIQAGQLVPWKRHIDSILAMEILITKHPQAHLLIIGSDISGHNNAYIQDLHFLIRQKHLDRHITFISFQEKIFSYLQQAAILIHPALNEPFGRVVMEALGCGTPVVCYNSGGLSEIIPPMLHGCITPTQDGYKGLAERLDFLLSHPLERKQLGKTGKEIIINKFSTISAYKELENMLIHL